MAKRRIINTRFWADSYISDLDPSEKLMFLYLLTNPYTNISGCYEISLKQIALDTGFDKEMVEKIIKRFEEDNKVYYRNGYVLVRNFVKHQELNHKVLKGIENEAQNLPSDLKNIVYDSLSYLNSNLNLNSNLIKKDGVKKQIELPSWINKEVWSQWEAYRKELKKPLKPSTIALQVKFLTEQQSNHVAIIKQSIQNGWTGLFPLKAGFQNNDLSRAWQKRSEHIRDKREFNENAEHNEAVRKAQDDLKKLASAKKI